MKTKTPVDLPVGYLDFYKNLESWQNQQQVKLKQTYAPADIDVVKVLVNTNRALIESIDFKLDPRRFQEVFQELLQFIAAARPETASQVGKISSLAAALDFEQLPLKILEGDGEYFSDLAQKHEMPEELLIFCVDHALRPFLRLWAAPHRAALSEAGFEIWDFATTCPFCASKSNFSRVRATDGRRFMFCDGCFSEWETRNIYCVHCGNSNPQTISYLTAEDFPAYQAFICEECRGYSKSFDERQKAIRIDPYITNMETVYLDLLAQEKGYTNHSQT
ncbi:MAG: formate dehydrogenase accessory protein FdhE [Syntrophomonas sp.]|nr:formate dehydrogenase accessory protein FdhE [Syntrophomonas sp.]